MSELNIKEQFKRFLLVNYGVGKEREFWKMMEAPSSPLYKACLQELAEESPMTLEEQENSEDFHLKMRSAFDKLTERVPEDEPEEDEEENEGDEDTEVDLDD